jgi:3-deoxy-D-manno-octulosonic-acid transferase
METEIWPRLIVEAKRSGAHVAIVNGRLSERSFRRYSTVGNFVRRVLQQIDLALMQTEMDAERIEQLGLDDSKTHVIGNLKFEISADPSDSGLVAELRRRFRIDGAKPLIIAASTHEPEEQWVLDSLDGELGHSVRLMIAPRHPERFDDVSDILERSPYTFARRSAEADDMDINADIILLDTIGELRGAYSLADIVFVGGSLIPHGGQSILEPAAAGKAIVTGPYTHNFDAVVNEFLDADAIMQTPPASQEFQIPERLNEAFIQLLENPHRRAELAANASAVMGRADRGAAAKTVEKLRQFLEADR